MAVELILSLVIVIPFVLYGFYIMLTEDEIEMPRQFSL